MTTPQHQITQFTNLGRLVALIDGVYAVALTLLVLDLKLPVVDANLIHALRQMLPGFLVYIITFASIAGYWTIHYGNFRHILHGDGKLVVVSILNLLFITLYPLSASIVGGHPLDPLATVFLTINSVLYCLTAWANWSYAAHNRQLLDSDASTERLQLVGKIMLLVAVGLIIAIPLAFLSVYMAYGVWIVVTPLAAELARVRRKHA